MRSPGGTWNAAMRSRTMEDGEGGASGRLAASGSSRAPGRPRSPRRERALALSKAASFSIFRLPVLRLCARSVGIDDVRTLEPTAFASASAWPPKSCFATWTATVRPSPPLVPRAMAAKVAGSTDPRRASHTAEHTRLSSFASAARRVASSMLLSVCTTSASAEELTDRQSAAVSQRARLTSARCLARRGLASIASASSLGCAVCRAAAASALAAASSAFTAASSWLTAVCSAFVASSCARTFRHWPSLSTRSTVACSSERCISSIWSCRSSFEALRAGDSGSSSASASSHVRQSVHRMPSPSAAAAGSGAAGADGGAATAARLAADRAGVGRFRRKGGGAEPVAAPFSAGAAWSRCSAERARSADDIFPGRRGVARGGGGLR
mmetsp:Transcript_16917/g.37212  ORF Transcript_16917/g.37212 Transcript_16917/m.37212 type:complete len:383 (+) Transcript_16917:60-1208(+)